VAVHATALPVLKAWQVGDKIDQGATSQKKRRKLSRIAEVDEEDVCSQLQLVVAVGATSTVAWHKKPARRVR
jgi:hypothetical protein